MTRQNPSDERTKWNRLVRRIARATGKPEKAEDYLHSAFIRLENYRFQTTVSNPEGLLVKMATNLAIDEYRHERVRAEAGQSVYDLAHLASLQPLQDEVLEAQKRLDRVRDGLAALSPRTREIFLMHRIDGLKYREIALRCGITVSAVEKHIAKAALFLGRWTEGW